ncbi:hypothetical protein RF11_07455 [Thelohanellus kitauei]|uniref:Uncharacterized protein n=1 Tax=Thelohanellus kitauei TaxID=669202 RepID=A0A0C2JDZ3_THEKT|nr:hypothetical protein RF11_07455 [Thelohanellus kitauei]
MQIFDSLWIIFYAFLPLGSSDLEFGGWNTCYKIMNNPKKPTINFSFNKILFVRPKYMFMKVIATCVNKYTFTAEYSESRNYHLYLQREKCKDTFRDIMIYLSLYEGLAPFTEFRLAINDNPGKKILRESNMKYLPAVPSFEQSSVDEIVIMATATITGEYFDGYYSQSKTNVKPSISKETNVKNNI